MTTATLPAAYRPPPAVPVFPLSIWQRVHLGIDENGEIVCVELGERNMLLGGEPGGGKSNALNLITAHGALSGDCKLILIDGKQVELGPWRHCADKFIGPSITDALDCARWLQQIMNNRYDTLLAAGLRKITPESGEPVYLVVIDEYAYFSATVGTKAQQAEYSALTRDLVARGRAAGVIVILATQRPSHQVIDPSLRDLFGYRWAFRCTTDASSDTVLGHGWAGEGYTAASIDPLGGQGRGRRAHRPRRRSRRGSHQLRRLRRRRPPAAARQPDRPPGPGRSPPRKGNHVMTTTTAPASQQAAAFQRLRSHLAYLRLTAAAEALPGVLDAARDEHLPVLDALEKLLGIEADATAARKLASRLHFAALPAPWTLDDYDFSAQPGADEALIRELATLRFVGEAANVVLIGPPGVGKVVLAEPVRVVTCGFVAC